MIKNDIQQAINSALKERRETALKVLRFVMSQIKYGEIDKQKDLTDEEIVSLMQKEIKKRKEAIEMFKKGRRTDLVKDEEAQITVIQKFLPQQLTSEELEKIVNDTISETADKNMGKIIGLAMGKVKGKADGSAVSSLVRQKLQQ